MKLHVCARYDLIDRPPRPRPSQRHGPCPPDGVRALLLEGSWPSDPSSAAAHSVVVCSKLPPMGWSLDEAIDGRFDWIDRQAADWAERLGAADPPCDDAGSPLDGISSAWLNALGLRYYLVKLIRVVAYFTELHPLRPNDCVELSVAAGRDQDYAELVSQHCRAAGAYCRVRWIEGKPHPPHNFPANPAWRRWAARLARWGQPALDRRGSRRRVVLCGNPRLLDPVCRELLTRRCEVWWLYDRFAVKSWLRWQAVGVRQLVCNSSLGRTNRLPIDVPQRMECRGINLAGPIRRWLVERAAAHGPRQTRLVERLDADFRRVRPHALVLDEDATPLARAAVAVGRRYGVPSLVVQHGAPCCRFGFAPPAADRILVWGRSSRRRLLQWDVPPERIRITGAPQYDALGQQLGGVRQREVVGNREAKPPRVLLLATVPPRDDRPDAVALHLTRRTCAEMLRMAFAAVARIERAELIVKLHPRSPEDPVARALPADFPSLRSRVVCDGPLQKWLAGVDCVLSCGSTAGVEAALAGVPVIQLAPPGASDTLPHDQWGLAGTARSENELDQLLARVLTNGWRPASGPDPDVLGNADRPGAAQIAEEILTPDLESTRTVMPTRRRNGHAMGTHSRGDAPARTNQCPR